MELSIKQEKLGILTVTRNVLKHNNLKEKRKQKTRVKKSEGLGIINYFFIF